MMNAVIFDMDGLLIDSEPFWKEAHVVTFQEVGVPINLQMTNETVGLRVDEAVEHWYSRYPWKGVSRPEVTARIIKRVLTLIQEKGTPREGVQKIVQFFDNKKFSMAIASSSPIDVINAVMEKLGIRTYMKAIISAEHESYGKPHPAVFITAAKALRVAPEACLVFEDSPNGVIAAKAARMMCVAIPYEELVGDKRFTIADLILPTLSAFTPGHLSDVLARP